MKAIEPFWSGDSIGHCIKCNRRMTTFGWKQKPICHKCVWKKK